MLILGIDNGLTVTKAVIFDATGRVLATARRRVAQVMPQPRHVERDMEDLWRQTAAAVAEAIAEEERREREEAERREREEAERREREAAGTSDADSSRGA